MPGPVFAELGSTPESSDFSSRYTAVTKSILQKSVELERFSLTYRMKTVKRPKFRLVRYFALQETGAAGALAYEVTGVREFKKGRKRPLTIDKDALSSALKATMITSIIAGSGSAFELSLNMMQDFQRKRSGLDSVNALREVKGKLLAIDSLLAERERLVAANSSDPAYQRAIQEGQVLTAMRDSFVNEFSHFYSDSRSAAAMQNMFFLFNAAYNTVGAASAGVGIRSLKSPKVTGTSNVLFAITGGMAMLTPLVATASGAAVHWHSNRNLRSLNGSKSKFDRDNLNSKIELLEAALPGAQGTLMPSLPSTQRFALYTKSQDLFSKQLDNELKVMRRWNQVALQTNVLGPPIGGLLMTQGILGTVGYYRYQDRPRKQLDLNYKGANCGTVATSMNIGGNAAWLLSSLIYEHRLKKNNQMPAQLIAERLKHLDDLEKTINAL